MPTLQYLMPMFLVGLRRKGSSTCPCARDTNPNFTVTLAGTGTVTSSPAGIDCGATCSGDFDGGTMATLTATSTLN
jgi:hypothetical protein